MKVAARAFAPFPDWVQAYGHAGRMGTECLGFIRNRLLSPKSGVMVYMGDALRQYPVGIGIYGAASNNHVRTGQVL